jgi:UDP-3-O-[3-hydroxymyristoyl] glucosamine N-acyltransferase
MPDMATTGITLAELASRVGATLEGDGSVVVRCIGTLENAGPDAVAFLTSPRFRPLLAGTRAAAVIVTPADREATSLPRLVGANPYAVYAKVAAILHVQPPGAGGIDPTARVHVDARVDPSATIGPFAVIGARAIVGAHTVIGAGATLGEDVEIGADGRLYPRVTIYPGCTIGVRSIVHAGAVIGADGFGMAEEGGRWLKIPQVGRVVIGADCEIGANTTIDRGAIDDTVIEDDVKLDNQIQIGHNCRIGAHTAIAGCVGIAGSVTIGRNCKIGGAAMVVGHITIPDNTVVSAATLVMHSIERPGVYTGVFPAMPHRDWQHVASELRRLRTLGTRVAALERALREQLAREGEPR